MGRQGKKCQRLAVAGTDSLARFGVPAGDHPQHDHAKVQAQRQDDEWEQEDGDRGAAIHDRQDDGRDPQWDRGGECEIPLPRMTNAVGPLSDAALDLALGQLLRDELNCLEQRAVE